MMERRASHVLQRLLLVVVSVGISCRPASCPGGWAPIVLAARPLGQPSQPQRFPDVVRIELHIGDSTSESPRIPAAVEPSPNEQAPRKVKAPTLAKRGSRRLPDAVNTSPAEREDYVAPEPRTADPPKDAEPPKEIASPPRMSMTVDSAASSDQQAERTSDAATSSDKQTDAASPQPGDIALPKQRPQDSTSAASDRAIEDPRALDGAPARPRAPAGSVLLPPEPLTIRSEHLERIAQQADRQIRRGFELAGRRAFFAAQAEFIRALRLVAQGLDAEHRTDAHSRALAAGLAALQEAEDFVPDGSRLEADLDLPELIHGHRTPVLKNADTRELAPLLAMKCYSTYAQEQLAVAAGREVAGSMALHALGKLHSALAHDRSTIRTAAPKAMVFFQAALLVYPQNYMAANDLGVLLARCGNYREAEIAIKQGLSIRSQATGWRNLAVVYRQLGQHELAGRADRLAVSAVRPKAAEETARPTVPRRQILWLDPNMFARTGENVLPSRQHLPAHGSPNHEKPRPPETAARASTSGWLPWAVQDKKRK